MLLPVVALLSALLSMPVLVAARVDTLESLMVSTLFLPFFSPFFFLFHYLSNTSLLDLAFCFQTLALYF